MGKDSQQFHAGKHTPNKVEQQLKTCYEVLDLMTQPDKSGSYVGNAGILLQQLQKKNNHRTYIIADLAKHFRSNTQNSVEQVTLDMLYKQGLSHCKSFTTNQLYTIKSHIENLLDFNGQASSNANADPASSSASTSAPDNKIIDILLRSILWSVMDALDKRCVSLARKYKTFDSVVADEIMLEALRRQLQLCHASELLDCYIEVNTFKQGVSLVNAHEILSRYLKTSSPHFVTITNTDSDKLTLEVETAITTKRVNVHLFDELQKAVKELIIDNYFMLSNACYFPKTEPYKQGVYEKLRIDVNSIHAELQNKSEQPEKAPTHSRGMSLLGLLPMRRRRSAGDTLNPSTSAPGQLESLGTNNSLR